MQPNKPHIDKKWLIAFVAIGIVFGIFYGTDVRAFEDKVLTALFGPRP